MDPLHLRTSKQWFKLVYFVSRELFLQWKSEAETQYINKIKVGMLRFKLEGRAGEALSPPPSFLPLGKPKAAPCHTWDGGSQTWLPIRITWAALKPQMSNHIPRAANAWRQRGKWCPGSVGCWEHAHDFVWFCLCLRTLLRECRTQSQKEQSSNPSSTTF